MTVPLRARMREWFRPPRRLRLQRGGTVIITGVFGLGIATLNTGNNLLYLLVGALLGLIALSGWLSEKSISRNRIERRVPHALTAGEPARIEYRVHNRKRRLPSVSLELTEGVLRRGSQPTTARGQAAYVSLVAPGETGHATAVLTIQQRGVYSLERIVVSTAYPFGLFIKERDVRIPGTLIVWPRTDRPVRAHQGGGRRGARLTAGASAAAAGAQRGDYRALRSYRPGDDPRDVHWRTSARRAEPIVREYDRDLADTYWIVLDVRAGGSEAAQEEAVELAASAAARASERGDRFGFAAGSTVLTPVSGSGQLEAVLDVLARVEFTSGHALSLPASEAECLLVTARADVSSGFADVLRAGVEVET